jgi:ParB-like chromosome segregation protein Spo0J
MSDNNLVNGRDLPIVKLVPRSERHVEKRAYQRMEASLRAVGLIEPLIVVDQGDSYEILDGHLRYQILLDMGVETVPCLLVKETQSHE